MTSSPTLSVLTTNYNHGQLIPRAIEAVVTQSQRPDQYIIVDDGSTDNSVEVINRYAAEYSFITFIRNERNLGALCAIKDALDRATGDYIYAGAADDYMLPGFLKKAMSILAQYPQAGLCCSYPTSVDGVPGVIRENRLSWSDQERFFSPTELAEVINGGYIAGHTSVVKRSALLEAGGYLPELKWHCDWFAQLVIGFRYGVCYIPESLAVIQVLPNSYSASGTRDKQVQREVLHCLLRLLKSPAYRDVRPLFRRGKVMSHFGRELIDMVLKNPEHWDRQTIRLIKPLLQCEAYRSWRNLSRIPKRSLSLLTPKPIKRIYRRIQASV